MFLDQIFRYHISPKVKFYLDDRNIYYVELNGLYRKQLNSPVQWAVGTTIGINLGL